MPGPSAKGQNQSVTPPPIIAPSAGDYGVLPFSKIVSQQVKKKIDKKYTDLENEFVKLLGSHFHLHQDSPPISRQEMELPDVTIEPVGGKPEERLQKLATDKRWHGIIFGHLEEDLLENALYLIVRVYLADQKKHWTFGNKDDDKIAVASTSMKKELNSQLERQIQNRVKEIQGFLSSQQPTPSPPAPTSPEYSTPSTTTGQRGVGELLGAEEQTDVGEQIGATELSGHDVVAPAGPPKNPLSTLTDVYRMLYEQNFYVHPGTSEEHKKAIAEVAKEKQLQETAVIKQLIYGSRNNVTVPYNRCWDNLPVDPQKGKQVSFCFFDTKKCRRREAFYGDYSSMMNSAYEKNARLPTIEELFALTKYLPRPYPESDDQKIKFWSSTKTGENKVWILTMGWTQCDNSRSGWCYQPRIDSLPLNNNVAALFLVADCNQR
ncbi:MAG: hypothetical protein BWK78_00220 [Thiotrichaceae bacterium IS1]|nr:MAG: hypothetical protein BWK78_00220 [Thiotrichaceae bacterium IS1]